MDTTFELLCTMTPKFVNKTGKNERNKVPSLLSLKKKIRRSTLFDKCAPTVNNDSLIIIEGSSSATSELSSGTASKKNVKKSPIVISDSDESKTENAMSVNDNNLKKIINNAPARSKHDEIEKWISNVNSETKQTVDNTSESNCTKFSDVSVILDDENLPPRGNKNLALNSTMKPQSSLKFHELFTKNHLSNEYQSKVQKCNDKTDKKRVLIKKPLNDLIFDDSFEVSINQNLSTKLKQKSKYIKPFDDLIASKAKLERKLSFESPKLDVIKKKSSCDSDDQNVIENSEHESCENLLDDLYGEHWRQNKNEILPKSEPRLRKTSPKADPKPAPKTERKPGGQRQILSDWRTDKSECSKTSSEEERRTIGKTIVAQTAPKPLSFLASLSATVPTEQCDPSARVFKSNFKSVRSELSMHLFKLFNQTVFQNCLPDDSILEWSERLKGTAGNCYCQKITRRTGAIERKIRIVLASKILVSPDRLRDTMIHEMCHAATWVVNQVSDGHGPYWKSWAKKAMTVHPELPPIKRCHNYTIQTKYTYKCLECGYSFGRHTKSFNIELKRCGYCYGKFEILINKTNKNGEIQSVPTTPKKAPTGFALFVKDNYATYKTPQLNHGQVMKVLGQKFTELHV